MKPPTVSDLGAILPARIVSVGDRTRVTVLAPSLFWEAMASVSLNGCHFQTIKPGDWS